ncbi:MAG TPA: class B sortase [Fusibacter sp.]|nr:class B sortase [Fusibacter sp.]
MKLQNNAFKYYSIAYFLAVSILLLCGCNSVQQEIIDKTKIPDVKNITELTEKAEITVIAEITDSVETTENVVIIESTSEPSNPFEVYISQNDDFMGWLKINGTSIDEPIVQGDDNAHYLEYDYTGAKNYAGAVFLDYKNQGNFYDNHMSLYAHYMEDGTMFHDLHKYKEEDFLTDYPVITLSGLRETKEYEIFSVHVVSAYDYYLYLNLSDDALKEYAEHFKRVSMHDKTVSFPNELKILTLVTCTYEFENARLLIHAYQK